MKLVPCNADAIKDMPDPEGFVNAILAAYFNKEFIKKSEIAGVVAATNVYKRTSSTASRVFDVITKQFKGLAVESEREDDVIFVPSEKLFNLLSRNSVLVVMKSPRDNKMGIKKTEDIYIKPDREGFV